LFAMLRVSRSVSIDALAVLRKRAVKQWGERGTPMALSAQLFYAQHGITRLRAAMKTPVHSGCRCMLLGKRRDTAQTIWCHIALALETHGSMEGLAADHKRRAQLLRQRRQERAQLSEGAEQRYAAVQAMLHKHGLPLCFEYSAILQKCVHNFTHGFIFDYHRPNSWPGMWALFSGVNIKLMSHVDQQNPLTIAKLEQQLVRRIVPEVPRHFTQLLTTCIEPLIPYGWMRKEHVREFFFGFCKYIDQPAVMTNVEQTRRVIHEGVAKIEGSYFCSRIPIPMYILCVRTAAHFRMYHVDHLFFGGRTLGAIIQEHFERMRPCNVSLYGLRLGREYPSVHLELSAPGELDWSTRDWLGKTPSGSYAPANVIWMDFTKMHSDNYVISAALAAAEIK
jgi:hypothetical protein